MNDAVIAWKQQCCATKEKPSDSLRSRTRSKVTLCGQEGCRLGVTVPWGQEKKSLRNVIISAMYAQAKYCVPDELWGNWG